MNKANSHNPLPVKHWDAGAAALFRQAPIQDAMAAIAVYAHHKGLPNLEEERKRSEFAFREEDIPQGRSEKTCVFNDARLEKFLDRHNEAMASLRLPPVPRLDVGGYLPPLFHRLALSCWCGMIASRR